MSKTRRETWDIIRIENRRGDLQFAVRLNGKTKFIELYVLDYDQVIRRIVFKRSKITRKVGDLYAISRSNVERI